MKKIFILLMAYLAFNLISCSDDDFDDEVSSENETEKGWGEGLTDLWDGTSEISWYDAEQKLFYLNSAEQLSGLAELVNAGTDFKGKTIVLNVNVKLNDDIKFDENNEVINKEELKKWQPIGNESHPFVGIFDGKNHVISGVYVETEEYAGLFGYMGLKFVAAKKTVECGIKNISVIKSYLKGGIAGGIIAETVGSANEWDGDCKTSISNCYSNSIIKGKDCGGITGKIRGAYGKITNCFNKGYVEGSEHAGGIAGICSPAEVKGVPGGNIEYCYNLGIIKSYIVGGIAGILTTQYSSGEIRFCYNIGEIKIISNAGYFPSAGGITGSNAGKISNCYSKGCIDVIGEGKKTFSFGGISGSYNKNENSSISNCYNITSFKKGEGARYGHVYAICPGSSIVNCYSINYEDSHNCPDYYTISLIDYFSMSNVIATFTDNLGILTFNSQQSIINDSKTLLEALNAYAIGKWKVDPTVNDGYPVFVE